MNPTVPPTITMKNMERIIMDATELHDFVQSEIKNPAHVVTNPQDIEEGQKAREATLGHIQSTMDIVKSSLKELTDPEGSIANASTSLNSFGIKDGDEKAPVDKIQETMGEKGFNSALPTLVDLTKAAEPILTKFDEVLKQPYLEEHNASVNTVPVLGVRNKKIVFIEKRVTLTGGTNEKWTDFGDFPPDAGVDEESKPQLFPFNGDLYLAIGRKVWRKEHRRNDDPNIKKAVNDFPKLYVDNWQKIGDEVLPENGALSILPFVQLSADKEKISSYLMILDSDANICVLEGDALSAQNTFKPLSLASKPKGVLTAPKWTKLVYFNSLILGYDDSHRLWELTPDFITQRFNLNEAGVEIEPTTELTATDVGPVVVRNDGYLWKRIISAPRVKGEKVTEEWARWIPQAGVTMLAVASPGVMLDLRTLTQSLRDRYVETQEHVLPVVNTIRAFASTHNFYLGELENAANRYKLADDEMKQELAIEEGKNYVKHAKVWAKILTMSSRKAKAPIDIMAKQFSEVKNDLVKQLRILEDKLEGLQSVLHVQEEQLSRQSAWFWASIGTIVLGLAVCIAGVVFAPAFLIGGGLILAGVVGAICFGLKMSDLADQMSKTQAKIRSTTTAITQMSSIVTYYNDISTLYATLLQFFGRMVADAQMLEFMDDATAMLLGLGLLSDTSSIGAAKKATTDISNACTSYIDVLSRQNINLPTDDSDGEDNEPVGPLRVSNSIAFADSLKASSEVASNQTLDGSYNISSGILERTMLPGLTSNIDFASSLMADGNCKAYLDHMESTVLVQHIKSNADDYENLRSGVWGIDPESAAQSLATFDGFRDMFAADFSVSNASGGISKDFWAMETLPTGSSMNTALAEAKPQVVELLQRTVNLAYVAERWADQYPTNPEAGEMDKAEMYQLEAASACKKALNTSAEAHNSFNSFNYQARQFQQNLDVSKNTLKDKRNSEIARANAEKAEYDSKATPSRLLIIPCVLPPLAIIAGVGVAAGYGGYSIYASKKKREIDDDLSNKLRDLDSAIMKLDHSSQSGIEFHKQSQTWVQLVENVSKNLTSVWSFLSQNKNLLIYPDMYRKLISINWAELKTRAGVVLDMLLYSPRDQMSMVMMASITTLSVSTSNINASNGTRQAKEPIIKSLLPGKSLAGKLTSQASKAAETLNQIQAMLNSPHAKSIAGINDVANGQKYTLFDIASILHTKYVESTSAQYSTISHLYSLSYLQGYRAREVANGHLSLNSFVKSSLLATRSATVLANRTAEAFSVTAKSFEDVLALIDSNLTTLDNKVKNMKDKIEETNTKLRDAIIQEIADVVALSFAIGCLGVAFSVWGAAAGPAIAVKAKIAAVVGTTGTALKTIIDSFKLADLAILISGLKDANRETQKALTTLKGIKPFFVAMTESVGSMGDELEKMTVALQVMSGNSYLWDNVQLDEEDVESLANAWEGVHQGCMKWMSVIDAQGISPSG